MAAHRHHLGGCLHPKGEQEDRGGNLGVLCGRQPLEGCMSPAYPSCLWDDTADFRQGKAGRAGWSGQREEEEEEKGGSYAMGLSLAVLLPALHGHGTLTRLCGVGNGTEGVQQHPGVPGDVGDNRRTPPIVRYPGRC